MIRSLALLVLVSACHERPVPPGRAPASPVSRKPAAHPTITHPARVLRPLHTPTRVYALLQGPDTLEEPKPVDDAYERVVASPGDVDAVNAYLDEVEILLASEDLP